MAKIESYKDLIVYQKAYKLALEIFEISKTFPREERFSLTDQIRRSSRAVTSCIGEAWAKRRYEKAFVSKLTDSLSEENETEVWLDYSLDCRFTSSEIHEAIKKGYDEVRRMLISMINNPQKWCV